ncbi:MAG: SDR family oxidoreductase [Candidatus Berkelbacteria bacterium]|nr:SDR family oxidoreductase [Candidatus Berkelbacteria bacterium]
MPTYLVAGGAGFIGSNLIGKLLEEKGAKVICLDNFLTGEKKNLVEFEANPNFEFFEHDIVKPIKIDQKLDYIINLACPASPPDYRSHPIETLEVCSIGVKNLLDLALRNSARFVHASTSEVYGDPLEHPQTESYWGHVNSYGERSCYDEGKRFAESLIYIYKKDLGLNSGLIRIFNTYGPKMRPFDGRVVTNFIRQALANEDITMYGDGKQSRSFCYVDDQIEAQIKMLHSDFEGPVNIGNPNEFTMLELAEGVIKLTDSKSKIVHKPLPADDPTQRQPDISLAKENLAWEPKVQLEEGLKKTIEWLRKLGY